MITKKARIESMKKDIVTGTTTSGFKFELEKNRLDDYEFFDILCEIDRGKVSRLPILLDLILGEEQKNRLLDHLRGEDGRVKTSDVLKEYQELFAAVKEGKN